jgi:hypothetical protein
MNKYATEYIFFGTNLISADFIYVTLARYNLNIAINSICRYIYYLDTKYQMPRSTRSLIIIKLKAK